jgi:hypothetical protein
MISQVVAAISAKLVSIGAWTSTISIGDEFAEETGQPPRIVLVPKGDAFLPVEGPGGNPRPLWDRLASCDVLLWGFTQDDAEGLLDQFIIAIHRAMKDTNTAPHKRGASYRLGKGGWDRKTNLSKFGFVYRMSVDLRIPVLDRDWTNTPMSAPDASTYVGDQALTNPRVPPDTAAVADVAVMLGDPSTPQGNETAAAEHGVLATEDGFAIATEGGDALITG